MATTWTDNSISAQGAFTTGTEAAPATATAGLSLCPPAFGSKRLKGVAVTLAADLGQTLSGAGSLLCYVYVPALAAWSRCPDLDVAVSVSGVRAQTWSAPEILVGQASSRIAYVPSGVTVSAGALTAYLDGDL